MSDDTKRYIQLCDCTGLDHICMFEYEPGGFLRPAIMPDMPLWSPGTFSIRVQLDPKRTFWGRLKTGLKYIFRPRNDEWYYSEVLLLQEAQIVNLRDFLQSVIDDDATRKDNGENVELIID